MYRDRMSVKLHHLFHLTYNQYIILVNVFLLGFTNYLLLLLISLLIKSNRNYILQNMDDSTNYV